MSNYLNELLVDGRWLKCKRVNGTPHCTKSYQMWKDLNRRLRSDHLYKDVELKFSGYQDFAEWLNSEFGFLNKSDGSYWEIDKDLSGLKEYSRESCVLVPKYINYFTLTKNVNDTGLPVGVNFRHSIYNLKNPYVAEVKRFNTKVNLGSFSNPKDAHISWQIGKLSVLRDYMAMDELVHHTKLQGFLRRIENNLVEDIGIGNETLNLKRGIGSYE